MKKLTIITFISAIILSTNIKVMAKNQQNSLINNYGNNTFISIICKDGKKDLNLEDIIKMIEESNAEIKLLNEKITILDRLYDRDLSIAQSLDNERDSERNYYNVDFRKKQMLYYKQTALRIHNVEHERDEKLKEIKRELKRQYLNVVNVKKNIKNIENKIKTLDNQIKRVQAFTSEGKGKLKDIEPLKIQKVQLQTSLNVLNIKQDEALLKVKQFLGVDFNDNLDLNLDCCNIPFIKFNDENIKGLIDKAIKNDYELQKKNKELEYAKLESHIYEKYGRNTLDGKTNVEIKIRDIESSISEHKLNLNIKLWTNYYDLKSKEDLVLVEKTKLYQKKMSYDEVNFKFNKGLLDKLTLDLSKLDYEGQKIQYDNSVNDYMISIDAFKDLLN